uniref:RNA-directed DNA polymerase, eukaryota, reverse transcriptase zinc-binding domain protein n=1 Tax=Tanacetum cinerariifolium TaxID=118510 RepID=A0A6L2JY64_TANCI|nr:RNA-directed DNA polymerase, eukaryota, reverse transcriptase zinc-binding domain protein [Tanacetum cinerariifolium]
MHTRYNDLRRKLMKDDVPRVLGILKFFLIDNTPEEEKVKIVLSICLKKTLLLHRQLIKSKGENVTWTEYKEAITLRFGSIFDDPIATLKNARHDKSAKDYQDTFDNLLSDTEEKEEEFLDAGESLVDSTQEEVQPQISLNALSGTEGRVEPSLQKVLTEYAEVFEVPNKLPPIRSHDHRIPLLLALMNDVFREFLKKFTLVFFDDILVYNKSLEDHLQHLRVVLSKMRDHNLYANESKCVFGTTQVEYLGHVISAEGVATDPSKEAMIQAPVLGLPNFNQPFIVETNASGIGLGVVFQQNGHLITYLNHYSQKYLLDQRITTPAQMKWLPKLMGYDYEVVYKQGKDNAVADALSRREGENPKEWYKWLSLAELLYKSNYHSSIATTSFEALYGQPLPVHVPYVGGNSKVDAVDRSLTAREEAIELLKCHLPVVLPQLNKDVLLEVELIKLLERKTVKKNNDVAVYGLITKEDDVAKIATSVYVLNFPESISAKELFHYCKTYGHVVDSFIPTKREKNGKRFGFVRFINVFNEVRLVNNLCTVWIDRYKLHANIVKFHRPAVNGKKDGTKKVGGFVNSENKSFSKESAKVKVTGSNGGVNSYVRALKEERPKGDGDVEMPPVVALDDDCLLPRNLSRSLLGRVKEFASLANLKMTLSNEGFMDIRIQYIGEFWVLMEFASEESKEKFRDNVSIGSWFSHINDASMKFQTEKRIAWVEIEGIPFKLWSDNTFRRIAAKWGELLDEFKVSHRGKVCWIRANETPGWVPDFVDDFDVDDQDKNNFNNVGFKNEVLDCFEGDSDVEGVPENMFQKDGQVDSNKGEGELEDKVEQSEDPFNIYPILNKKADKVRNDNKTDSSLKYPLGFSPIENKGENSIHGSGDSNNNIEGLKESNWVKGMEYSRNSKLKNMSKDDGTDRHLLDSNSFSKDSVTMSDSFVMVRDVWRLTGQKCLLIAVYAPQDAKEKQMLWDYLQCEIGRWKGEVVIMGDFNEVRYKYERFGLVFNVHGANMFNSFIMNSGLVEVNSGRSSFMWCHKSASKMSKLDRFLISENLLYSCPNIHVITLERYLLDHRPILLREAVFDYGPTPFKFFHHWLEMDGFIKAKVKWIVEGDENSSFFHGMLNKKHNILNIRGVMVDGVWVDNPKRVKKEFFAHFSDRFCRPTQKGASIQTEFSKTLSEDQVKEMECDVTNDEIKRAVWDCGTKKSPGPDGFTFGFFRRFWYLIQKDVNALTNSRWTVYSQRSDPMVQDEKKQALIFKVDFEKAYDSVRWDFLDEVLRKFGFEDKWCNWIQCFLKSSRGSITVNGSPTEEFQFGKRLKQGDPLSHFLFILTMESLHLSFQHIVDAGMYQGIKLGGDLVNLSHIFYADDVVFVGQWCESNITTLVYVLECFYMASGLRINMSKSKIMGVNMDCDKVNRAAVRLGCLILKTPFSYLGSIVGGHMSWKHTWNEIVERVKKRLSKWKMKTLSIGGRMTLVKSMLVYANILLFLYFKSRWVLFVSLKAFVAIFNGHETNSKKASWVNWKKALVSKDRGESTLWTRVIKAIHGEDGRIGTTTRGGPKSCWMVIIQEMYDLSKNGIDLLKYLRIKLGNGENTTFWEDKWCLGGTLKDRHPRVNPRGGCEQEQFEKVKELMKEVSLAPMFDRWTWELENTGDFSVASVCKLIDAKMLPIMENKTRWINYVPIKVNIHAWKVMTDSLPTRYNISRRGICIDSILCANFDTGVETTSHLFFSCCMARKLVSIRLPMKNKKMLEGVFYVMWWLLWLFRNKIIFEDKTPKKEMFFDDWVWRYLSHDNSLWSRVISAIHGLNGQVLSVAFNSTWSIINEVNSLKDKCVDLISHCKINVGKRTCTSFLNDLWIGDSLLKLSFPHLYALDEKKLISVADKMRTSISFSFRRPVRGGVESQQHDHLSVLLDSVILSNMEDRWF